MKKQVCRGSISFLMLALILPLIFLLFSISLDLEKYFTQSSAAQKVLDDTALYAYHFLPQVELARSAALSYLSRYGELTSGARIDVAPDRISLDLNQSASLTFPAIFGLDLSLPIALRSEAWGAPLDVLLALDSSGYLAPPALASIAAWGDPLQWSAAQFFRNFLPRYDNGVQINPAVITQQCFNPVFSGLKRAVISAYDYLSTSSKNSVGVLFFPSSAAATREVRAVQPAGPIGDQLGEANFDTQSASTHAQDSWCGAAFEQELQNAQYFLPAHSHSMPKIWDPSQDANRPLSMVEPGSWNFDQTYQPWLEARQVIWSRAVQEGRTPQISRLLEEVRSRTIGALAVQSRKNLSQRALKIAIIAAGDVPWDSGQRFPSSQVRTAMQQAFQSLHEDLTHYNMDLRVYFVIAANPDHLPDLEERAVQFSQFLRESSQQDDDQNLRLSLKMFYGVNAEEALQKALSTLLVERRTALLAR